MDVWWNTRKENYIYIFPNECPRYDIKQSDGEVPVMLELWGMQSTPSLLSLPGLLWPGDLATDMVFSMGQIELNCVLMLNWTTWNRTVLTFKLHTELFELELFWHVTECKKKLYLF